MLSTRFTQLIGCSVPIQQAGMGRIAPPELAAAVSEAGGLGMIPGMSTMTPADLEGQIDRVRSLSDKPFGVNFIVAPVHLSRLDRGCIELAGRRANLVEFFYNEPDPALVELAHHGGALVCWQIGSREEAVAAVVAGCDLLVAQGIEAGGHVRGRIGLLALLDEVLEAVNVPVLAAGGIGSGRAVAAVLAAGADGVRVGTRFLAAVEAATHPDYFQALISARAEDTVYTDVFSATWPDAPHRVLRSSIEAAQAFEGDVVGENVVPSTGQRTPVRRFAAASPTRDTTGAIGAMSLWAGESVGEVRRLQPAAQIVRELADDAEQRLRRWEGASTPR